MSDKYYVGGDITSFADNGKYKPISRVTLLVDDENSLTAGDDTGMEIVASCPHATQAMVNALLQTMKGYQYQAYEAGAANIDPAAELGDGVTVGGIYSPLSKLSDDGRGYADISSPGEAEMEDEYPSEGYIAQEFNRKIAVTRSLITKSAEEINLEIQGVDGRVSALQLTVQSIESQVSDAQGNISTLQQTAQSLQSQVNGKIDGNDAQTLIDQTLDTISFSVSGTDGSTTFAIKQGSTTLDSTTFDLHVKAVNITGTLTASQIQASSIYVGDLADGSSYATKTYVQNNAGLSASEVDDAIATYIDGTSITAESLRGRTVDLLASATRSIGSIELVYTSTGYGMSINTDYGGVQISSGGNVFISSVYNTRIQLDEDAAKLGPSVWATNGTVIYDSDRNIKNSIDYDLTRYRQFLLDLKPCRFKYNEGQSGRYHIGMIAQDVEQSLYDNGIDSTEFSGWCKAPVRDEEHNIVGYTYGLRYDAIIPLNTMMIQELVKRIDAIETKLEGIA